MLRPANLQTAFRRLLSPKLRLLRYLHTRWDSYPAGTTFTGAGLPPAGITDLSRHTWTNTGEIISFIDWYKESSVNKLPNWYCCDLPDSAILSGCWMQLLFIGYEKSTRR